MLARGRVFLCVAASLAVAVLAVPVAAQDNCVSVVGTDWASESQSWDPFNITSVDDILRITAVYEKIIELDNDFQPVPVLAESWEANDDGTVWDFHIRQGVTFHDGTPLTAADVVYTYKRLIDPEDPSGAAATLAFLDPDGIEAVDDHIMRITLERPSVELPILMSTKFAGVVRQGATTAELQAHPNGTGPFMKKSVESAEPFHVVEANPDYWRDGLPKVPCLTLMGMSEPVARMAALKAGQIDLAIIIDPSSVKTLENDPNVVLSRSPSGSVMTLSMWADTPPFDDVRVRQAMKLVVDRERLTELALLGAGEPGNDTPVAPTSVDAFRSDLIQQDIEEAKRLLAEAGYPDGIEVDLYTSEAVPGMSNIAQVYADMAAPAGIHVNVIMTPSDTFWDDIWLKRSFITSSWGGRPTSEALAIAYRTDSAWKETHWERPEFDALLDKANATLDADERRGYYQEAQAMLAEDGGVIVPSFMSTVSAMRKGCSGYESNNNVNNQDFSTLTCD